MSVSVSQLFLELHRRVRKQGRDQQLDPTSDSTDKRALRALGSMTVRAVILRVVPGKRPLGGTDDEDSGSAGVALPEAKLAGEAEEAVAAPVCIRHRRAAQRATLHALNERFNVGSNRRTRIRHVEARLPGSVRHRGRDTG
jgi:hypothetical protein